MKKIRFLFIINCLLLINCSTKHHDLNIKSDRLTTRIDHKPAKLKQSSSNFLSSLWKSIGFNTDCNSALDNQDIKSNLSIIDHNSGCSASIGQSHFSLFNSFWDAFNIDFKALFSKANNFFSKKPVTLLTGLLGAFALTKDIPICQAQADIPYFVNFYSNTSLVDASLSDDKISFLSFNLLDPFNFIYIYELDLLAGDFVTDPFIVNISSINTAQMMITASNGALLFTTLNIDSTRSIISISNDRTSIDFVTTLDIFSFSPYENLIIESNDASGYFWINLISDNINEYIICNKIGINGNINIQNIYNAPEVSFLDDITKNGTDIIIQVRKNLGNNLANPIIIKFNDQCEISKAAQIDLHVKNVASNLNAAIIKNSMDSYTGVIQLFNNNSTTKCVIYEIDDVLNSVTKASVFDVTDGIFDDCGVITEIDQKYAVGSTYGSTAKAVLSFFDFDLNFLEGKGIKNFSGPINIELISEKLFMAGNTPMTFYPSLFKTPLNMTDTTCAENVTVVTQNVTLGVTDITEAFSPTEIEIYYISLNLAIFEGPTILKEIVCSDTCNLCYYAEDISNGSTAAISYNFKTTEECFQPEIIQYLSMEFPGCPFVNKTITYSLNCFGTEQISLYCQNNPQPILNASSAITITAAGCNADLITINVSMPNAVVDNSSSISIQEDSEPCFNCPNTLAFKCPTLQQCDCFKAIDISTPDQAAISYTFLNSDSCFDTDTIKYLTMKKPYCINQDNIIMESDCRAEGIGNNTCAGVGNFTNQNSITLGFAGCDPTFFEVNVFSNSPYAIVNNSKITIEQENQECFECLSLSFDCIETLEPTPFITPQPTDFTTTSEPTPFQPNETTPQPTEFNTTFETTNSTNPITTNINPAINPTLPPTNPPTESFFRFNNDDGSLSALAITLIVVFSAIAICIILLIFFGIISLFNRNDAPFGHLPISETETRA